MTIKDIAIKNLLRRKAKAAFVLAGLVIGVATVVAVISYVDAMTASINEKLEKYGANILIAPRTDNLTLSYGGITIGGVSFEMQEIEQASLQKIDTIKNAANVAAVGPVVLGGVNVGNQRAMLAGVDFEALEILKPWWKAKGAFPHKGQVLLGAEAARILNHGIGDTLFLSNQALPVSGVLMPTGSQDDHLIFTDLATAQTLLGKTGKISLVEVAALCTACPIGDMVEQISAVLPMAKVMAIEQVVKGRMETLGQFKRFAFGISAVIALIGGMVVLVTLMGSVRERRQEIGIFRAIGFRKSHIMRIIFTEAGLVSFIAGVLGFFTGMAGASVGLTVLGNGHSGWLTPDPVLAVAAVSTAVLIGLAAGTYPAIMASRLDPNDALKTL